MVFHRILTDPKPYRDFALREALDTAQHEYLTIRDGKRRNGFGNHPQFLPVGKLLLRRGRFDRQSEILDVSSLVDGDDPGTPQMRGDHGVRGLEEVVLRMADELNRLQRGEPGIGFLNDIVGIQARGALMLEPRSQGRFVRQYVPRQP